jgi:tRNA pseudouridine55 synthase
LNGFINLYKPAGITSSDAVVKVRRLLPKKTKVGHMGTLDPDASGVLVLAVGGAPRLFSYMRDDKSYVAEMTLGVTTDTLDASGEVLERRPVAAAKRDVEAVLPSFVGTILQRPPRYSAVHIAGKRGYELARAGVVFEPEERPVTISALSLVGSPGEDRYVLGISCSSGTYIRSLVRDIGERLGCGAHMSDLLRTRVGDFHVKDSITLNDLQAQLQDSESQLKLTPMEQGLAHLPRAVVSVEAARPLMNGAPVSLRFVTLGGEGGPKYAVFLGESFIGIGFLMNGALHVERRVVSNE